MPVIPVGYAQVTHIFGGFNLPRGGAIVYGIVNEGLDEPNSVAAVAGASFSTHVLPLLTADVALQRTDVKLGPNETGLIGSSITGAGPGEQSNLSEPPNTSYLVTKSSAIGGRRGRGRIFLPGVDSDNVGDNGVIGLTHLGNLQTALDTWLDALQGSDIGMYLLHDYSYTWEIVGGQPRRIPNLDDDPPFPNVVTALTISATVATQRRRLR